MTSYNYYEAINNDARRAIREGYDLNKWRGDREGLETRLNDDLWIDDAVTGNASGSYTFSAYRAMEYVTDNPELLSDAAEEFGMTAEEVGRCVLSDDWERLDVTIRCYLLSGAVSVVLDELEEAGRL